jgi:predicted permease
VTVISHGVWARRFGSDPAVLGRTLVLDAMPVEIIGVASPGFAPPTFAAGESPEFYRPGGFGMSNGRGGHWLPVIGRLAPGTSLATAQQEISSMAAGLAELYPRSNTGLDAQLQPLSESVVGQSRAVLALLMAAVGLLLVIACANVAGLLRVRTMGRISEFGVRIAIGAGPGRVVRQLVVESGVLGAAGALLGVLLAWGLVGLSGEAAVLGLPRFDQVQVDGRVLAFAALVGIVTSVLSGVLPSVAIFRGGTTATLRSGGASAGPGRARLHRSLVAGEIALSVVLLTVALLLARSYGRLAAVDPGFAPEGVAVARLVLPEGSEAGAVNAFYAHVLERVRALPGVTSAGAGDSPPFQSAQNSRTSYWPEDRPTPADDAPRPMAYEEYVTSGYFKALGIPLLAGRDIGATDGRDAVPVAVVSQAFADEAWPGRSALGRRFSYNGTQWEVIGVVGSVRRGDLTAPPAPEMFFPQLQHPLMVPTDLFLAVRGTGDPAARIADIRRIVQEADPDVPVELATTMTSMVAASLAPERVRSLVLVVFALAAMVLAGLGVYSIMAYSVAARRRELAVRRSLGAPTNELLAMIDRRALALVSTGVGIGLVAAVAASGLVQRFLFGVAATDPVTLGLVALVTLLLGVLASALPARRAAQIDPVRALREQEGL